MNLRKYVAAGFVLAAWACILTGCQPGDTEDFHVYLKDAKGLTQGDVVRWRGVRVGEVSSVDMEQGRVCVRAKLSPDYQGKIRSGVKAKPYRKFMGIEDSSLELFGGHDSSMPVLPAGSEVPEAGIVDRVPRKYIAIAAGVFVLVALFALLLKGIVRVLLVLFALGLVGFSIFFFSLQWKKYGTDVVGPETEARIAEIANEVLQSPEAQAAWEGMQTDMADAFSEARKQGGKVSDAAKERLAEVLEKKIAELTAGGQQNAAEEIAKLRKQAEGILAADE